MAIVGWSLELSLSEKWKLEQDKFVRISNELR